MLGWGIIAERRVSTLPIVEHLDILKNILGSFAPCGVAPMRDELTLEGPEEAFDTGSVPTVTLAAHAGDHVAGPHPIRSLNRERALEGVHRHRQPVSRVSGGAPLRDSFGPNPGPSHEPGDALLPDAVSRPAQRIPDAGTAVGFTSLVVEHPTG